MGEEEEVGSQAVRSTSGTVNLIWPPVINYTSGWVMVTSFHAVVVSQGSLGLGAGWAGCGGRLGNGALRHMRATSFSAIESHRVCSI